MRAFTVYWDPDTDVTEIKYSQRFKYFDGITKVDVLMDAIADLSEMQQAIMDRQSVIDKQKRYDVLYKANKIAEMNGEEL